MWYQPRRKLLSHGSLVLPPGVLSNDLRLHEVLLFPLYFLHLGRSSERQKGLLFFALFFLMKMSLLVFSLIQKSVFPCWMGNARFRGGVFPDQAQNAPAEGNFVPKRREKNTLHTKAGDGFELGDFSLHCPEKKSSDPSGR